MKRFSCCLLLFLNILSFAAKSSDRDTTTKSDIYLVADQRAYAKLDNLTLLGKIWGFMKYHHPAITGGSIDWDKSLVEFLPEYIKANSVSERNHHLEALIKDLGPLENHESEEFDSSLNFKLKPDYSWVTKNGLSPGLITIITSLSKHTSTKDQQYLKYMSQDEISFPTFIEKPYQDLKNIPYEYKILAAFRFWNIIEYFYPYKNLVEPWDEKLGYFVKQITPTVDDSEYSLFVQEMVGTIKDSHATSNGYIIEAKKGKYQLPFFFKFIEGSAVVTSVSKNHSASSEIRVGSIIKKVNGELISDQVKKVRRIIPASNEAVMFREAAKILNRAYDTSSVIEFSNSSGGPKQETVKNHAFVNQRFYDFPHQRDSTYFFLPENILYINIGSLTRAKALQLKSHVTKAAGIIFDCRQYPQNPSGDLLSALILPDSSAINLFSTLVKGKPGYFKFTKPVYIGTKTQDYFKGTSIILVNENTQSAGEYLTMVLQAAPNSIVVGTNTAGTDGNVSMPFALPGGIYTKITALGVYYPDGRETQQIGIVPDEYVAQTISGIATGIDEQLERGIFLIKKKMKK